MADPSRPRRVEVGFAGGLTLALRLHEDAYRRLSEGIGQEGVVEIESEESRVHIDRGQVVYVRLEIDRGQIGF